MKPSKALKILNLNSRQTLNNYVSKGELKATISPTGRYDYNDESVYQLRNNNVPRLSVIYSKSDSTKNSEKKINEIIRHCIKIPDKIFSDVSKNSKSSKHLYNLLDLVHDFKIKSIYVYDKTDFKNTDELLIKQICNWYGTSIFYHKKEGSS